MNLAFIIETFDLSKTIDIQLIYINIFIEFLCDRFYNYKIYVMSISYF